MKLRVSAFAPEGLVLDGVIVDAIRAQDSAAAGIAPGGGYQVHCTFTVPSQGGVKRDAVINFHRHDVVPFGWTSPSRVYSFPGRHTNLGIVKQFDAERCVFDVSDPETGEIVSVSLGELELLPALSGWEATPPWAVGTRVAARRYHIPGLCAGVIVAANSDLTYTIRYFKDGAVQDGMLHRDIKRWDAHSCGPLPTLDAARSFGAVGNLVAKLTANTGRRRHLHLQGVPVVADEPSTDYSSEIITPRGTAAAAGVLQPTVEERVTVRSVVLVALMGQHLAVVVQALGGSKYRAVLLASQRVVTVAETHITTVRPVLNDALGGDPEALRLFLAADETLTGSIPWSTCKRALRESTRDFGHSIPESKLRSIYGEVHRRCGRPIGAVLGKALLEDGDLPLTYADFEFALRRYRNAV